MIPHWYAKQKPRQRYVIKVKVFRNIWVVCKPSGHVYEIHNRVSRHEPKIGKVFHDIEGFYNWLEG